MDKENSVQTDNKVEQPTHLADTTHYDVIIVGGGMIGASMALALSTVQSHQDDQFQGDQALSIAMVDAVAFQQSPSPSFDDRSVALSYGSKKIFETLGIWSQLSSVSEPIEHIHVSDKGHMGMCRLHAEDYEQEALGYVVENRALGQVLHQQLTQRGIDIIAPAEVVALDHKQHSQNTKLSIITLKQQQQRVQLSSPLIIAADGAQSPMATRLNIAKQRFDYPQMAAICNIKTSQPLSGWAFERLPIQDLWHCYLYRKTAIRWSGPFLPNNASRWKAWTMNVLKRRCNNVLVIGRALSSRWVSGSFIL